MFIFPIHPSCYPQQHDYTSCGLFSIKAIIETQYPDMDHVSGYYASSRLHRKIKNSSRGQLMKTLLKYNIDAHFGIYDHVSTDQHIAFLKSKVQQGPVLISIAHSYNKKTWFSVRRTFLLWHHMTVWGFDDEKRVFYCYDSHTDIHQEGLPIGNIAIDYDKLMIYWKLCGFGLLGGRYIACKLA